MFWAQNILQKIDENVTCSCSEHCIKRFSWPKISLCMFLRTKWILFFSMCCLRTSDRINCIFFKCSSPEHRWHRENYFTMFCGRTDVNHKSCYVKEHLLCSYLLFLCRTLCQNIKYFLSFFQPENIVKRFYRLFRFSINVP